jgi:acetoin utilization deacetylase AcuC-like enzyme
MTTAIYSHPDCQRHDMGDWHPESPARLQAISDQLIGSHIDDLLELPRGAAGRSADLRNHSRTPSPGPRQRAGRGRHYPLDGDTSAQRQLARRAARRRRRRGRDRRRHRRRDRQRLLFDPPARPPCAADRADGLLPVQQRRGRGRHALDARGLERVAIVDFDVHHGNGTEEAFLDEPRALMVSFFQHPFYPYTSRCRSRANQVNVPVPAHSKGDVVRKIVTEQWLPALHAFKPEMIFISAGFDAHREDDIGGMGLVEPTMRG